MRLIPPILLSLSVALASSAAAADGIPVEFEAIVKLPPLVVEGSRSPGQIFLPADVTTKPEVVSRPTSPTPDSWLFAGDATYKTLYQLMVAYVVDENGKVWNPRIVRIVLDSRMTEKQLRTALGKDSASLKTIDELRNALGAQIAERTLTEVKKFTFRPGKKNGKPVAVGWGNVITQSIRGGGFVASIGDLYQPRLLAQYGDLLKDINSPPKRTESEILALAAAATKATGINPEARATHTITLTREGGRLLWLLKFQAEIGPWTWEVRIDDVSGETKFQNTTAPM